MANFRLSSIDQQNHSEQNFFNKEEYKKFLYTKFLPMCKQSMLQDEAITQNQGIDNIILICSDFIPTLTNHGICLTKNAANLDRMFKPGDYLSKFKETFFSTHKYIFEETLL